MTKAHPHGGNGIQGGTNQNIGSNEYHLREAVYRIGGAAIGNRARLSAEAGRCTQLFS